MTTVSYVGLLPEGCRSLRLSSNVFSGRRGAHLGREANLYHWFRSSAGLVFKHGLVFRWDLGPERAREISHEKIVTVACHQNPDLVSFTADALNRCPACWKVPPPTAASHRKTTCVEQEIWGEISEVNFHNSEKSLDRMTLALRRFHLVPGDYQPILRAHGEAQVRRDYATAVFMPTIEGFFDHGLRTAKDVDLFLKESIGQLLASPLREEL